jgi:YidC/Oxa1 family membrane protein insertase
VMPLFLLEPIEGPLTALLEWLHGTVGLTWAWSIVAITIIVRTLLLPLTVRQIHSMQNLQRHAPQMKAIQQKYKHDRQRQQEELMRFYRENQINPAASCLPILFQIPVFLGLFFVLRDFEKDVLPEYPDSELGWLGFVPSIIEPANSHWSGYVLLALYAVSQTFATFFMSATMERTQRILLLALPLIFLFFILNFPTGLVIYWVTTNLWTVGQGLITRRLAPRPQPLPKRTSRTPPKEQVEPEADGAKPAATPKPAATAGAPPRRVKRKKKKRARR